MNVRRIHAVCCTLIAALLLQMVALSALSAETRRAVIIGIDKYEIPGQTVLRGNPAMPLRWANLEGAVKDAQRMQEVLVSRYGFERKDIVLLPDGKANRQAIIDTINSQLIAPSKRGDVAFFYFAGHGSRVRNSLSAELDKLDETIVPADVMSGARDIRDKELRDLFNMVLDKGARLVAVFDSCQSGSISRGLGGDAPYRTRLLPIDPRDAKDSSTAPNPWERGAVILSASQDSEVANEDVDEFHNAGGRFTIAFTKAARSAPADEPILYLFRRVQGAMRNRGTNQEPVLETTDENRKLPLFGRSTSASRGGITAAVQNIDGETITLQEGLGAGLTAGSELTRANDANTQLRIELIEGITRSRARVIAGRLDSIQPGDLFYVTKAAPPDVPNLRVWIAKSNLNAAQLASLHETVRVPVEAKGYTWVTDPVKQKPTHIVQFADGKWLLSGPTGEPQSLGPNLSAATVANQLPPLAGQAASVYLMLPVAAELDSQLVLGRDTKNNAIERGDRLKSDYFLMGSVAGGQLRYSWVRPWLVSPQTSTLPMRTDWVPVPTATAGSQLTDLAIKLGFINTWLTVEGATTAQPFPYRLALRDVSSGRQIDQDTVVEGQKLAFTLVSDRNDISQTEGRFVYVCVIDNEGKRTVLYPKGGAVENKFPLDQDARPPQSYALVGREFSVGEPFGIDTYMLITTSEQLSDPQMLQSSGVINERSAKKESAFSALLRGIGAGARGVTTQSDPAMWSIDRITVKSVPKAP